MGNNTTPAEDLVPFVNGRKIYPEVAQYITAKVGSQRAYEDAVTAAQRTWNDAETAMIRKAEDENRSFDRYGNTEDGRAWQVARDAKRAAERAAEESRTQASADLLLKSPHQEVRWIAENCLFAAQGSEIENHAMSILKMLPATVDEIWTEAKDNRGMCEVFDKFYALAEKAGIFNDGNAPSYVRELIALRNYIRRNYGHTYVSQLMDHVNPLLKKQQEAFDAKLAAAKAEWQKLDEAYAEQTHRNRSEGARKAAETRRQLRATLAADIERESVSV